MAVDPCGGRARVHASGVVSLPLVAAGQLEGNSAGAVKRNAGSPDVAGSP